MSSDMQKVEVLENLCFAAEGALMDLRAMIEAADRGEVWTVNAGTRLRIAALSKALSYAALARIGGAE